MSLDSIQLSTKKTVDDWKIIRPKLVAGATSEVWADVVTDFYYDRLESRYLRPIKAIADAGSSAGEGFSIVAIQCSLVEFLESCVQGINYVHYNPVAPYEYNKSREVFVAFLRKRDPFRTRFDDALAHDFYSAVRCGVLHEACTKKTWRIWDESGPSLIVDPNGPILYRDDFQKAISDFIGTYRLSVPQDVALQQAFIRKFDHLSK